MRTARFAASLVVALLLVGCASGFEDVVGPDADGTQVDIGAGRVLRVELPSNPTTGYGWQVMDLPEQLRQVGEIEYEADPVDEEIVGAGGTEILRFEGVEAGNGTLRLEYRRAWETTATPDDTFEIDVTVR
ncbi:MAG: protease inhibitor I42 family protein [Coriobacteriia bacterium]|nr:protease inhibitor I42 family protein [Coriobacteriia bacterium]